MTPDRLLNVAFMLGSAFLLGRQIEKDTTWKRVKKFFPIEEDIDRPYKNTSEFLYGLFLSTGFVTSMHEDLSEASEAAALDGKLENVTGLYL